jgi:replication factor C subunit 3/5
MVLELNASDDRGIDVVREQIKTFASTKQIFTMAPTSTSSTPSIGQYKLIILDEADAMTATAQMALRRIMEKYTANTRFCIIANYTHKLSPALLSRCTRFRFSPLKDIDIRVLVDKVIDEENVNITPAATDALVKLSKGDMRRALNVLQACHASSKLPFPPIIQSQEREKDLDTKQYGRHTTPHKRHSTPRPAHHAPGPNHRVHRLRMHRLATPSRHLCHRDHAAENERRDVLSPAHQHSESEPGLGVGGYYY